MTRWVKRTKRTLDVVIATVGLLLTVPLYPLIALAIYLQSPGPIFFRQRRAGELLGPVISQSFSGCFTRASAKNSAAPRISG